MEHINLNQIKEENLMNKRRKIDDETSKALINYSYLEPDFMKALSESFCKKKELVFDNGAKIISDPFTCCVLPNFLQPKDFTRGLLEEIEEVEVDVKHGHFHQFKQSKDLSISKEKNISLLKDLFYGKLLKWIKQITNIRLTDKVDISCSCYTYTDNLLCHNDELEERRIAYVYYLVPEWEEEYGGRLDLFNAVNGEPSKIVTSFIPKWNNLIFFEVSPVSFHQVSEIISYKARISISGWFYGPPLKKAIRPPETILFQPPIYLPIDLEQWINPVYLQVDSQTLIRDSFEDSSEIELFGFFQADKYEEICRILMSDNIVWKQQGPLNRRNYEVMGKMEELPEILKDLQTFFQSESFLFFLSNMTGLSLHPAATKENVQMAGINSSIRKWSPGSYALLHDQSFLDFPILNVALCFNCIDWQLEHGGFTTYVARSDLDKLLRVDPKPNTLAMIYITEDTTSYVKYINCQANERSNPCFHDIFTIYREEE